MKGKRKWMFLLVIPVIAIAAMIMYRHTAINVYDGFENSKLSSIWSTERMESSSYEFQSAIVRKGRSAIKITLRTGDIPEAQTAKDKATERDELQEDMSLYAVEGSSYEYRFSMFLPDSFPITKTRLVIAQWKQFCSHCACTDYSPILALRYVSGKLFITIQTNQAVKRDTIYQQQEEIRGRWLDFRFQVRFSKQKEGEVIAFLNDKEIVNYHGITSYPDDCLWLSTKNKYYFKMGLYRDKMPEPMWIYIDEYQKKEIEISK